MEKKVKVMGEEVIIRFNMAVELAYEEITEKPFSLDELKFKKNLMALFMAAIIANNPNTEIKFEKLLTDATIDEVNALEAALVETTTAWFKVPNVIPADKQAKDEDAPKN